MTPAQEKALWDFAVKEAAWIDAEAGTSARQARLDLNDAARALLSAEEAPPVKKCPHSRRITKWPEPTYCNDCGEVLGAAPAPKQEVRDALGIIEDVMWLSGVGQHACDKLGYAIRLLREERAASELTEKAYQQVCRANVSAHEMIEELRTENASLRDRIARATAWRRKFGPPDDTDIRILEGREDKGKATEATK